MPPPPESNVLVTNTNLPAYRITTFNVNSLSAYATTRNSDTAKRHANIVNAIGHLLRTTDILALQETHLGTHDRHTLKYNLPNHHIFYNNYKRRQRGTMLIISNKILKHYHYDSQYAKAKFTEGRIQTITFTPKNTATHLPFRVINVYLQADSDATALETQLNYIHNLPRTRHTYILGDFNFTESPSDTSSPTSDILISGTNSTLWDKVCAKHQLHEIRQSNHTHFFIAKTPNKCRSSRIDRIYTSFSPADLTLIALNAHTPRLPINITNSYRTASSPTHTDTAMIKKLLFSDHMPVSLSPSSTRPSKRRGTNVPRWLADTAGFKAAIEANHGDLGVLTTSSPFLALDRWKAAVRKACKEYFRSQRDKQKLYTTTTAELSASIQLLRMITCHSPNISDIKKYLLTHKTLKPHLLSINELPIDSTPLRNHIHCLLTDTLDKADLEATAPTSDGLIPLPPSSCPQQSTAHQSLVNDLKKSLPTTRRRLNMLRDPDTDSPSTEPNTMARIIQAFWGSLWAKSGTLPSFSKTINYLSSYPTRVPANCMPHIPSLDCVLEHVHGTNNSAAGPDGIPFAIYRLCADEIAPILHAIICSLAKGDTPPPGYNHARLFIIPKNDSIDIAATRPISVTNADNRIIAKALTTAITPTLKAILHPDQKGFVPGRQGEDHIFALNQAYYSAQSRKQQYYILFLDTKKAFDSIHHDFILATLDVLGMPQWFCCVISGLLDQVRVEPVLSEDTGISIPIHRGVKQGCPLSPLLFVICYDVLLHKLTASSLTKHAKQFAFADDLAIASHNLTDLTDSLHIIHDFATYSGLGLNIDKTEILTTRTPSYADTLFLREEGYGTIAFTNKAIYLGVLMGSKITTIDIFAKAYNKVRDRAVRFRPVLNKLGLHKRILIYNIFILPVMYYLAQFFIIPYDQMILPIKDITHKQIVAYNGGGFGYAQLITPRDRMGPHTPLRDLWSNNYTLLAGKFTNFQDSHGFHLPQMGQYNTVHTYAWNSLLITEHRARAAFHYLELYCPRDINKCLIVDRLKGAPARTRRLLYRDLVRWGYRKERSSILTCYRSSLPNKLKRVLSLANNKQALLAAHNLRSHARLASAKLTPYTRNTFLRLVHNALPTDIRRVAARQPVRKRAPPGAPGSPYPCYLCGQGEDSFKHLLASCQVVRGALERVAKAVKHNIPYNQDTLSLNFTPTSSKLVTHVIMHFTTAIWHQRLNFFSTLNAPPPMEEAINRLTTHALDRTTPPNKQKHISTTKEIATLALNPPPTAIVCFTDGSAIPNPGPCGAGVVCSAPPLKPRNPRFACNIAASLGDGDNNLGEFQAIYIALTLATHLTKHYSTPLPILIFSDSLLAICFILHGWKLNKDTPNARKTRTLYKKLSKHHTIRLYWVRGHAKVPGNEEADVEAKAGARGNKAGAPPIRILFPSTVQKYFQLQIRSALMGATKT